MKVLIKNKLSKPRLVIFMFAVSIVSLSPFQVFARENATYDPVFFGKNDILLYSPADVGCTSNGGSGSEVSGENNRQKIWNYLIEKGLSAEQAAGILGNIQTVSGSTFSPTFNGVGADFNNPDTGDPNNGGYGIIQWTGERRSNIVKSLASSQPDLMKKYYIKDYSSSGAYTGEREGYIPKNVTTGEVMPTEDNDTLLLAELKFLIDEMKSRTLHQPAIDKGYGRAEDNEWDALKKQTTVRGASDIWVYSFEIPENDIDTVAIIRELNSEAMFKLYSGEEATSLCSSGGSKQQLADQIIKSPNVTFWNEADAQRQKQLIQDVASGSNNGNDFPCGVNILILRIIVALSESHKIQINDINRACTDSTANGLSSSRSLHYNGNGSAIDLQSIDSQNAWGSSGANLIVNLTSTILIPGSRVGQSNCDSIANLPVPEGVTRLQDGCTHLHLDVPVSGDPALRCKSPLVSGVCSGAQLLN